jgi:hypothetical protein
MEKCRARDDGRGAKSSMSPRKLIRLKIVKLGVREMDFFFFFFPFNFDFQLLFFDLVIAEYLTNFLRINLVSLS